MIIRSRASSLLRHATTAPDASFAGRSKANRTEYSNEVMTWCGSHMNGYSLALIPSADAEHAQPTCTSRAISQAILLMGRRSTRAAISPGTTKVVPPTAPPAPDVPCAIAVPLCAMLCHAV